MKIPKFLRASMICFILFLQFSLGMEDVSQWKTNDHIKATETFVPHFSDDQIAAGDEFIVHKKIEYGYELQKFRVINGPGAIVLISEQKNEDLKFQLVQGENKNMMHAMIKKEKYNAVMNFIKSSYAHYGPDQKQQIIANLMQEFSFNPSFATLLFDNYLQKQNYINFQENGTKLFQSLKGDKNLPKDEYEAVLSIIGNSINQSSCGVDTAFLIMQQLLAVDVMYGLPSDTNAMFIQLHYANYIQTNTRGNLPSTLTLAAQPNYCSVTHPLNPTPDASTLIKLTVPVFTQNLQLSANFLSTFAEHPLEVVFDNSSFAVRQLKIIYLQFGAYAFYVQRLSLENILATSSLLIAVQEDISATYFGTIALPLRVTQLEFYGELIYKQIQFNLSAVMLHAGGVAHLVFTNLEVVAADLRQFTDAALTITFNDCRVHWDNAALWFPAHLRELIYEVSPKNIMDHLELCSPSLNHPQRIHTLRFSSKAKTFITNERLPVHNTIILRGAVNRIVFEYGTGLLLTKMAMLPRFVQSMEINTANMTAENRRQVCSALGRITQARRFRIGASVFSGQELRRDARLMNTLVNIVDHQPNLIIYFSSTEFMIINRM